MQPCTNSFMAIVLAILAKVSAILESVCENVLEFLFSLEKELTLSCIMLKNGQTYLKILKWEQRKIFKVCLAIFQHDAWKF